MGKGNAQAVLNHVEQTVLEQAMNTARDVAPVKYKKMKAKPLRLAVNVQEMTGIVGTLETERTLDLTAERDAIKVELTKAVTEWDTARTVMQTFTHERDKAWTQIKS